VGILISLEIEDFLGVDKYWEATKVIESMGINPIKPDTSGGYELP